MNEKIGVDSVPEKCKGCQYEYCYTQWYIHNRTCGECDLNGDPEECPLYGVGDYDPCDACMTEAEG